MRFLLKALVLFAVFLALAGISGYLTLRFIIKSEDTVVVPELVGKDVIYALNILTDLGLNIKVSGFEYRGDVPKNHVAYQDPASGSVVKRDRNVRIIISKGPKSVVVPDLAGMDIRQAQIIMEQNGLLQGVVSRTLSPSARGDEVIGQVPAAGTEALRGDALNLLVSLGRRPMSHKMPHLDGMTLEDAIAVLERHHLGLGRVKSIKRHDRPSGVVVAQDPLYGYQVASGGLVNLIVNRLEEGPMPDKGLRLLHYGTDEGFLKTHVRIRVNVYGLFYPLFDGFASPGEQIWLLIPSDPEASVLVYENDELVLSPASWDPLETAGFTRPGRPGEPGHWRGLGEIPF